MAGLHEELALATQLAREAGELLAAEARRATLRGTTHKLIVDNEMGDLIVSRLAAAFPADGILCEDTGKEPRERASRSGRTWLIDPHDGTSDFSAGRRETSTSIALVDSGQLVLGLVRAPCVAMIEEPKLRALLGGGPLTVSWVRGGAVEVERGAPLPEGPPIAVLSQKVHGTAWERNVRAVEPLAPVRCASVATRLAVVAAGIAEIGYTLKNRLASWDFAAGQALLQGAGGDLIDPSGAPFTWRGSEPSEPRVLGYIGARDLDRARALAKRLMDEVFSSP